ncbi:MAG: hypothetical protein WA624_24310 [Methylocella sp.]
MSLRSRFYREAKSFFFFAICANVRKEIASAETSVFAGDLISSFEDGGAFVNPQPSAVFIGQRPIFGLLLQASQGFDATKIQGAISSAAAVGKSESLKNFPAQSRADIYLYVGHKPQPF